MGLAGRTGYGVGPGLRASRAAERLREVDLGRGAVRFHEDLAVEEVDLPHDELVRATRIHGAQGAADDVGVDDPAVGDPDRAALEARDDALPLLACLSREPAAGLADAVALGEGADQRFPGAGPATQPGRERQFVARPRTPGRPGNRVEHAVENDCPDVVGEHGCVGRPQVRTVRDPVVGQLIVAQSLPDQVHVAGRVGRGHVIQKIRTVLGAGVGDVFVEADQWPGLSGVERYPVSGEPRHLLGRSAAKLPTTTDPTGVDADHVEVGGDLRSQESREELREIGSTVPRARPG